MAKVRESIATDNIAKTAENTKGYIDIELFNCILINQIIFPKDTYQVLRQIITPF